MKILFISAGNFIHVEPYLQFFSEKGYTVGFLALSETDLYSEKWDTIEPVVYKYGKLQYLLTTLIRKKQIKAFDPDIIHAHYATSGGLCGCLLGLHPLVLTAHGTDLTEGKNSFVWRPLLKRIFRVSDTLHVVSTGLAEMAKELGVVENKIIEINVGIDTQRIGYDNTIRENKNGLLKMISTRRFEPVYNPRVIFEALRLLDQANINFHMTFVGGGPLKHDLEEAYSDLIAKGKVILLGQVKNSELPGILAEHDVYLSASLWDGTSLSLLEAFASGLFPVVSNIPANQAWITNEKNGLLHDLYDPLDLVDKILFFLENISLFKQALPLNRELVEKKGDRVTNMLILEDLYKSLVTEE